MLPYPALRIIADYTQLPSMGLWIKLAQVNRQSREFFLSDALWVRFDVYAVKGTTQVYQFKDYKLFGIAAHFMNFIEELRPCQRPWYFDARQKESMNPKGAGNLYAQMNVICHTQDLKFAFIWSADGHSPCENEVVKSVTELHLAHLTSQESSWYSPDIKHFSRRKEENRLLKYEITSDVLALPSVALLAQQLSDRDVNMRLVNLGYPLLCAPEFQEDEDFMLDAIRHSFWNFGSTCYARTPEFVEIALDRIPGLLEFVEENFWSFFKNEKLMPEMRLECHASAQMPFSVLMFPQWMRGRESFARAVVSGVKPHFQFRTSLRGAYG